MAPGRLRDLAAPLAFLTALRRQQPEPHAAAFLTPAVGWVTGIKINFRNHHARQRIVSTSNGGRSWRIEYTTAP